MPRPRRHCRVARRFSAQFDLLPVALANDRQGRLPQWRFLLSDVLRLAHGTLLLLQASRAQILLDGGRLNWLFDLLLIGEREEESRTLSPSSTFELLRLLDQDGVEAALYRQAPG